MTLGVTALAADSGPSFAAPRSYPAGPDASGLAIGDLDGDGKLDLATKNQRAVSVLLKRGDGGFQAKREYEAPGHALAIGDLNGDGRPDVATANGHPANTVSVLINRGDGSFQTRRDYRTGGARTPQFAMTLPVCWIENAAPSPM